eukprot:83263-Alexandrium_andersonii.AAC.1
MPSLTVKDCKSLYRTIHREGWLKVLTETGLAFALAALRQVYREELPQVNDTRDSLVAEIAPWARVPTIEMAADK